MAKKIYISKSNFERDTFNDFHKEIKDDFLVDNDIVYEIVIVKKYKVSCTAAFVEVKK